MGLKVVRVPLFFLSFLAISSLNAAPVLRLSTTTAGPVSIATGTNGPAQTVQAINIGDGTLALNLSSSVPWLTPSLGTPAPCAAFATPCIPLQIGLQTSALAKGIYTGIVTVSDPNALDAPQDITVTVQMGGAVPDTVDLYVAPNGSTAETTFSTNSTMNGKVTTANGQSWLSFSLTGTASFRFSFPYRIAVTDLPGMAEGPYAATITTSGSSFASDNKTIAVTMHVTSQPIAQVTPASLTVRLAQGAPQQTYNLTFTNSGLGTLAINATFVNTGPGLGPAWLSVLNTGLTLAATIDPGGLDPGTYQGTLLVETNGANGRVSIPVSLLIVPQSAPVVAFQGVQDSVLFGTDPLAPGEIATVMGEQFTFGDPVTGQTPPLSTNVGGAQVLVNDNLPAPVFSAAYGQISFQVPYETPSGPSTLRVIRDDQVGNAVSFTVVDRAPRLMRLGIADYGNIVNQDGTNPIPLTVDGVDHPAHAGDQLTIYGTGFGQTDPPATTGAPAPGDTLQQITVPTNVTFGGGFTGTAVTVLPSFVGLTPGAAGLYQIIVTLPDGVTTGPSMALTVNVGGATSNTVRLAID